MLDTSAAVLLRDNDAGAKSALARLNALPMLSAVTRVELEGGMYARPAMTAQRRRRLDQLLSSLAVVDFDSRMAGIYGSIVAQHGFSRRKIIDRMIAATALAQGAVLITANVDDFVEIDDLKLETWPCG